LARLNPKEADTLAPFRYLATGIIVIFLIALFLVWRLDNPRVEKLRADVIDAILPKFEWVMAPATGLIRISQDFRSYQSLYEQNTPNENGISKVARRYFKSRHSCFAYVVSWFT